MSLVRFRITRNVHVGIADRKHDHRCVEQSRKSPGPGDELRIAGLLEKQPHLLAALEDEQVDTLAEARRGSAYGDVQH